MHLQFIWGTIFARNIKTPKLQIVSNWPAEQLLVYVKGEACIYIFGMDCAYLLDRH